MLYKKQWHSWFHSQWVQNEGRCLQGDIYKHVDTTIIMQFPQKRNKHCWKKMCQNSFITWVLKFFVYGIQCCNLCNLRSSESAKLKLICNLASLICYTQPSDVDFMFFDLLQNPCQNSPTRQKPNGQERNPIDQSCTWLFQNLDP
jgi:hypothetical protein